MFSLEIGEESRGNKLLFFLMEKREGKGKMDENRSLESPFFPWCPYKHLYATYHLTTKATIEIP